MSTKTTNNAIVNKSVKKSNSNSKKPVPVAVNATISLKYDELLSELNSATCKYDLVNICNSHNIYTTTQPKLTKNSNDLYIQFFDKSRLLVSKTKLKVLTCEKFANELTAIDSQFKFDTTDDGSYRIVYASVAKNVDNLKTILDFFATKPMFFAKIEK